MQAVYIWCFISNSNPQLRHTQFCTPPILRRPKKFVKSVFFQLLLLVNFYHGQCIFCMLCFSNISLLAGASTSRSLPVYGCGLPPGRYEHESFTNMIMDKVVSKRGPYDLFTGERNKTNKVGHYAVVVSFIRKTAFRGCCDSSDGITNFNDILMLVKLISTLAQELLFLKYIGFQQGFNKR